MADRPLTVEYNPDVPVESFDVIVVDECHRSIYGLWRGVLEYFDAHLVGLTATPTRQTRGFFDNNEVSRYTYEQAVADGVNVDFDIVRVRTDLREEGVVARIEAGTTVRIRDRQTRTKRYEELDEDFTYTAPQIGRTVITEDEVRAVLTTFRDNWKRWFPGRADLPKTLIFAGPYDDHADEVVKQVRQIFGRGDDFAKKITYRSRDNGDDPDALINDLRNSSRLRVAVTVDMIATGTDVKPLECVIFLRPVKSPVMFEQMKGRGARSIDADELKAVTPEAAPDLKKDRFVLIDAVGVTDSPLVDARPLIPAGAQRGIPLAKLLDKAGTRSLTADEAETLARRLARIDRQLGEEEKKPWSRRPAERAWPTWPAASRTPWTSTPRTVPGTRAAPNWPANWSTTPSPRSPPGPSCANSSWRSATSRTSPTTRRPRSRSPRCARSPGRNGRARKSTSGTNCSRRSSGTRTRRSASPSAAGRGSARARRGPR